MVRHPGEDGGLDGLPAVVKPWWRWSKTLMLLNSSGGGETLMRWREQAVARYWRGRARRLLPTYYSTLAFVAFLFLPHLKSPRVPREAASAVSTLWFNFGDGCPGLLWANVIFLNNQIPRGGCMKYAWSQAVQVQAHGFKRQWAWWLSFGRYHEKIWKIGCWRGLCSRA